MKVLYKVKLNAFIGNSYGNNTTKLATPKKLRENNDLNVENHCSSV